MLGGWYQKPRKKSINRSGSGDDALPDHVRHVRMSFIVTIMTTGNLIVTWHAWTHAFLRVGNRHAWGAYVCCSKNQAIAHTHLGITEQRSMAIGGTTYQPCTTMLQARRASVVNMEKLHDGNIVGREWSSLASTVLVKEALDQRDESFVRGVFRSERKSLGKCC